MVGTTIYNDVNHIHGERWLRSRTRACRTRFPPDGWMDGRMDGWNGSETNQIVWTRMFFLCKIVWNSLPDCTKFTQMHSMDGIHPKLSLFFWYSDPWITRRERELGSMDQKKKRESLVGIRWWDLRAWIQNFSLLWIQLALFIWFDLIWSKLLFLSRSLDGPWIRRRRQRAWLGSDDEFWELGSKTSVCFGFN